jgi:hypothetical protein
MWNLRTHVVPTVKRKTETTSNSFRKDMSKIQGRHDAKKLQKTAILSKANIHTWESSSVNTKHSA